MIPSKVSGIGTEMITQSQNFDLNFSQRWNDAAPQTNNATIPDIATMVNIATKNWTYYFGEFNDNSFANFNLVLFEGWAHCLHFQIELYDDDTGTVDTFGTWSENWVQPTESQNITIAYDYNVGVGNNANITYNFEVLAGPELMTASDLLDAYKLYLYSDVETIYDDPATYVFGRVIEGNDTTYGENRTCLQYLFYFPYEYSGTDVFIHYWDWEMVLIFLDLTDDGSYLPYRLVWDNGYYFSSSQDWIDGQDYRIYENDAPSGTWETTYEFTDVLKPLLGDSRTMTFKTENLSQIWTSDMEKWGFFKWGLPTFQATIDTSYHQFDLGDATGTDPMDMKHDYNIYPFTTNIIK
jgi:hypothetical protein